MTFQQIVLALQKFWSKEGCVLGEAYDTEKGAGTMNPATFLRVIGPEPWNVAYVEPSRRPDDGRYGENPNRLYQHHQFQVIMKPSPNNIQETYLESLKELGIDPEEHDIRFVEDNWESPTLGAWGIGWEVWLDGMEITSAGHLSARNFSFSDEIMMDEDGKLNFYVDADFDVDAAFGTFVLTDKNDDWLNIYANYDIAEDRPCDTLELTLCKGDGSEESWSYPLNAAEQEVLMRKMEEFCQQQTGMSLREYAQQLHEEQAHTAELQL